MQMRQPGPRIEAHVANETGDFATLRQLDLLGRSAGRQTWRVDLTLARAGDLRCVLRSDGPGFRPGVVGCERERQALEVVAALGMTVPPPRWPALGLCATDAHAFFQPWREGISDGDRIVRASSLIDVRKGLMATLAGQLAVLHRVTPVSHPSLAELPDWQPPDAPAEHAAAMLRRRIEHLREPRPELAWAWAWLSDNLPTGSPVSLVHGDFHVGNLLVSNAGLEAIVGWSRTGWGCPALDLAAISLRRWRFDELGLPVGGLGRREPFYAAYDKAGGTTPDRAHIHWWEVALSVRHALDAVEPAEAALAAGVADLDRLLAARRAVEWSFEALRLAARGPAPAWN